MAARYRLLTATFIRPDDHLEASLRPPGDEIEFSGTPSRMMEPLNDEARENMKEIRPLNIMGRNVYPGRGQPPSSE
jgi:hypothetical protein